MRPIFLSSSYSASISFTVNFLETQTLFMSARVNPPNISPLLSHLKHKTGLKSLSMPSREFIIRPRFSVACCLLCLFLVDGYFCFENVNYFLRSLGTGPSRNVSVRGKHIALSTLLLKSYRKTTMYHLCHSQHHDQQQEHQQHHGHHRQQTSTTHTHISLSHHLS